MEQCALCSFDLSMSDSARRQIVRIGSRKEVELVESVSGRVRAVYLGMNEASEALGVARTTLCVRMKRGSVVDGCFLRQRDAQPQTAVEARGEEEEQEQEPRSGRAAPRLNVAVIRRSLNDGSVTRYASTHEAHRLVAEPLKISRAAIMSALRKSGGRSCASEWWYEGSPGAPAVESAAASDDAASPPAPDDVATPETTDDTELAAAPTATDDAATTKATEAAETLEAAADAAPPTATDDVATSEATDDTELAAGPTATDDIEPIAKDAEGATTDAPESAEPPAKKPRKKWMLLSEPVLVTNEATGERKEHATPAAASEATGVPRSVVYYASWHGTAFNSWRFAYRRFALKWEAEERERASGLTWRAIPGFGRYEICREDGTVRVAATRHVMRPYQRGGYLRLILKEDASGRSRDVGVSHLQLTTYVGPPPDRFHTADHIDSRDRSNNKLENLRWATRSQQRTNRVRHAKPARAAAPTAAADLEGEHWAPVNAAQTVMVSNMGRVWNLRLRTKRLARDYLTPSSGIAYPRLKVDGKFFTIHSLVASRFLEAPPAGGRWVLRHVDGDKCNAAASNLKWVTPSESSLLNYREGMRKHEPVRVHVSASLTRTFNSLDEASRATGIPKTTLRRRVDADVPVSGRPTPPRFVRILGRRFASVSDAARRLALPLPVAERLARRCL